MLVTSFPLYFTGFWYFLSLMVIWRWPSTCSFPCCGEKAERSVSQSLGMPHLAFTSRLLFLSHKLTEDSLWARCVRVAFLSLLSLQPEAKCCHKPRYQMVLAEGVVSDLLWLAWQWRSCTPSCLWRQWQIISVTHCFCLPCDWSGMTWIYNCPIAQETKKNLWTLNGHTHLLIKLPK